MRTRKKNSASPDRRLTDVELELMNILWKLGEASVADVIEQLPEGRQLAYTSVSTILRILEQKEVLGVRKEGRGHIYIPILKKTEYESKTVQHVVDNVFGGTPVALVRQLLNTVDVTDVELKELEKLISQMGKKK